MPGRAVSSSLLAELTSTRSAFAALVSAFLSLAISDFLSDAIALDFEESFLVDVEAAWPKLNMLSKPRTATIIISFFVIFIRILSIAGIRGNSEDQHYTA